MEIVSIVATVTLDNPLDIDFLSKNIEGSVYQKSTGHWLKYRLQPENRYIAFYKSGKFLITGKGAYDSLNEIVQRVIDILHSIEVYAEVISVDINNIVCKDKIELNTSLENVITSLNSENAEYEPEQFPALVYKNWGVTFLIFSTGSVIITGAKTVESAQIGIENLKNTLATLR